MIAGGLFIIGGVVYLFVGILSPHTEFWMFPIALLHIAVGILYIKDDLSD